MFLSKINPKTKVWCIAKPDKDALARVTNLLNDEEQKQAARFKNQLQGHWWANVRFAMRNILGSQLGCKGNELEFSYTSTNKPFLAKLLANQKQVNVHFNLSHCSNAALLVISNYAEVGIDIENIKPIPDMKIVAKHFFSDAEQAYFEQFDTHKQCDIFYEIWTQKESLIKANGGGLSLPLSAFDVVDVNAKTWTTVKPRTEHFENKSYALKQLNLKDVGLSSTHKAAICFAPCEVNEKNGENESAILTQLEVIRYYPEEQSNN